MTRTAAGPSHLKQWYWTLRNRPSTPVVEAARMAADYGRQLQLLARFVRSEAVEATSRSRTAPVNPRALLVISYYAAPYRAVFGTQRLSKFMKYLSRRGWHITLVTTAPRSIAETDPADEPIAEGIKVIRLAPPALSHARTVPDRYVRWVRMVSAAVQGLTGRERPAVVFSTAPPYSNLLAAAICARRLGRPLVSDFRDPWSRIDRNLEYWAVRGPVRRAVNAWLERRVLAASQTVIMADGAEYADAYFARAGWARPVSILNGYDESDFPTTPPARDETTFTLSYVGIVYDDETFLNLVTPLRLWWEQRPHDFARIVFHYAGPSSGYFDRHGFRPPFLRDHGYLSHRDAIALRMRSDVQLFAQPRGFKPHVLSGKIYEMIRSRVRIVAITNPDGAVARLLRRTRAGLALSPDEPRAVTETLRGFFDTWSRKGRLDTELDEREVQALSREKQAVMLASVLEAAGSDAAYASGRAAAS